MPFNSKNIQEQALLSLAEDILIQQHPTHFSGDELFVANRAMGFLKDEKFVKVLNEIAIAPVYKGMAWRVHTLIWAVNNALKLPGDLVECGVFRGFKSLFICKYFEFEKLDRKLWLFDTYEGIAEQYSEGSPINKDEHNKPHLLEFVKDRFSSFHNVNIVQGAVPDSLQIQAPEQVSFIHLDMNSYQAEIGALEFFWPKMPVGAVVILDDYGFKDFYAQKEKEDEWFEKKGHRVLELPTGQGMVVKLHD